MKYLSIFLFLSISIPGFAQSQPIIIDGKFDDWENIDPFFEDEINDASGIDFLNLWVASDLQFLYFNIEVGSEIELSEGNDIQLYIDTDNNASTGSSIQGIGADFRWEFGERDGLLNTLRVFHNDIGLITAPTVSGNRFEFAIRRDDDFYDDEIFSGREIKFFLRNNQSNGDRLPESGVLTYELIDEDLGRLPDFSFEKYDDNDLRVLSYNVKFDGFFDITLQPAFRRILQAVQPDIIGFQEIYDHSSAQVAAVVETMLPSAAGEQWYHDQVDPDIKVVSRFPITKKERLEGGSSGSSGNGVFLLDLSSRQGGEMLFVNAHPPCCNNDQNRQAEMDNIMGFIRDSKAGTSSIPLQANTPIVIVGDMNMVGDNQQLNTFLTGNIINEFPNNPDFRPDWDESDFEDAIPLTPNYPGSFTWYNEFSSFSPGRLDLVIYSGSVMELKNSYSLFTPTLTSDELQQNGLNARDATVASDHLPVIADFEILNTTSVENSPTDFAPISIAPNPFGKYIDLKIDLPQAGELTIELLDLQGRLAKAETVGYLPNSLSQTGFGSENSFRLDGVEHLPKGVYVLRIEFGGSVFFEKIVK